MYVCIYVPWCLCAQLVDIIYFHGPTRGLVDAWSVHSHSGRTKNNKMKLAVMWQVEIQRIRCE